MSSMQSSGFAWFVATSALLLACEKKDPADAAPPSSASAMASASAAASAPAPEKPWYVGDWQASLEVERYKMEMKKSEGMVKDWEEDDGKQGTGKATLKLTVNEDGQAEGTLGGALGDLAVNGVIEDETLRLKLMAENTEDPATTFNGVIVATKKGDTFTGELKASSGDSLKVRKASVVLSEASPEKGQ